MGRKPKAQAVATPKRGRPRKHKRPNGYHDINGAQVLFSDSVEALQKEVIKLNEWCLEWREKYETEKEILRVAREGYDELRGKYNEACTEVIGSHAIIKFLEAKLKGDAE